MKATPRNVSKALREAGFERSTSSKCEGWFTERDWDGVCVSHCIPDSEYTARPKTARKRELLMVGKYARALRRAGFTTDIEHGRWLWVSEASR